MKITNEYSVFVHYQFTRPTYLLIELFKLNRGSIFVVVVVVKLKQVPHTVSFLSLGMEFSRWNVVPNSCAERTILLCCRLHMLTTFFGTTKERRGSFLRAMFQSPYVLKEAIFMFIIEIVKKPCILLSGDQLYFD